ERRPNPIAGGDPSREPLLFAFQERPARRPTTGGLAAAVIAATLVATAATLLVLRPWDEAIPTLSDADLDAIRAASSDPPRPAIDVPALAPSADFENRNPLIIPAAPPAPASVPADPATQSG